METKLFLSITTNFIYFASRVRCKDINKRQLKMELNENFVLLPFAVNYLTDLFFYFPTFSPTFRRRKKLYL
jgi:hypothetical protein